VVKPARKSTLTHLFESVSQEILMLGKNFKAGIFVLATILLLVYMILRINQGSLFKTGGYPIFLEIESAVGIDTRTQVQIAGVGVGEVKSITLLPTNKARVELNIRKDIVISENAMGLIKVTGVLGDAYIEIYQPGQASAPMRSGSTIKQVTSFGDFNSVTGKISAIADDVKAVTEQMKKLMAGDESVFDKTVKNIESITGSLERLTQKNEDNVNAIISNFKALAENLNQVVASNRGNIDRTVGNMEDITTDLSEGKGSIGRLLKDETTVDKINDTLDGVSQFVGGANRTRLDLGMHTEYLAGTGNFKNYVSMSIKPRPDKYFLFEVVSDPDPSFNTSIEETTVSSGGNTSVVTTRSRSKELDGLLFSFQIAKRYRDFSIRGGLIESSGGVGIDYDNGPVGLSFTAFDFKSEEGEKPHLKALARTNLTKSFYLLAGVDDIINPAQDLAWYLGAGLTFTDDDIKSLLGLVSSVGTSSVK